MNAQAAILWWEQLATKLRAALNLECSVECRPIHVQVAIDDDRYLTIGDMNGPIGFDAVITQGEVLDFGHESKCYVGEDVESVFLALVPFIRSAIDGLKNGKCEKCGELWPCQQYRDRLSYAPVASIGHVPKRGTK